MKKPSEQILAKAYEIGVMKLLKEVAESGDDVHENHTPSEICDMMLDKVDLASAKSILVLYNIELLFSLRKAKYQGNVTFFTQSTKKAELAPKIFGGVNVEYIDKEDNPLYLMENKWPDKFDIVIANPPYGNGGNWKLHLDFLNKSLSVCSGDIVFVHPSNQFIKPQEVKNNYLDEINSRIEDKLVSLKLFNGNPLFNISKHFPLSLTHIKVNKNKAPIIVENIISGTTKRINSITEINLFNDYEYLPSIKNKVKTKLGVSLEDMLKNRRAEGEKGTFSGNCFIQIDSLVGSTDDSSPSKMWKNSFFSFVGKSTSVRLDTENLPAYWFDFPDNTQATNFLNYLKTDFARFCLSLMKTDKHVNSKMWLVPWMDFTQEWTDEKLYAHFNITDEEKLFINKVIPPYYE